MSPTAPKTALILGATGRTGSRLLPLLLASDGFAKVAEYGRRVTPKDQLATGTGAGLDLNKLEQKTMDFEKIEESGLKDGNWDVVFITLATKRAAAGSTEQFEKIDRGYVLSAAKEARSSDPSIKQKVVYISAAAANPTSSLLYPRSKGKTEEGLADLGYSETVVLRPAFFTGADSLTFGERAIGAVATTVGKVFHGLQIDIEDLVKGMVRIGSSDLASLPAGLVKEEAWANGKTLHVVSSASLEKIAKLDV